MSRRHGHVPNVARQAGRPRGQSPEHSSRDLGDVDARQSSSWEAMFQALSSSQQSELLSLAERQGLLYAHQLPPLLNGAVADSNHSLLGRLLNDQDGTLDPSHPDPISV